MKKIIIGVSSVLIVAFVVLRVVNAQEDNQQKDKKATTEVSKNCGKCPAASECCAMAATSKSEAKKCNPEKCKAMGCDPAKCKEGKCDPSTCKKRCAGTGSEAGKCDPAKCSGMVK